MRERERWVENKLFEKKAKKDLNSTQVNQLARWKRIKGKMIETMLE